MSGIAKRRCKEILASYTCDLSDMPDTREVRAREIEDSGIFRSTYRRLTARGMRENHYYRIYENSFSRCRNRFDECGRVSLTSKRRK